MRGGRAVGLVLLLVLMGPGCRRRATAPEPAPADNDRVVEAPAEAAPVQRRPMPMRRVAGGLRLAPVPEPEVEPPARRIPRRPDPQPSNVSRSGIAPPSLSETTTGPLPLWKERAKHY
jgi:hypothetical protein